MNRVLGIARRRAVRVGIAAGVILAVVLALAAPAYAHHSVLHGSTECSDGDHLVHWSIQNVNVVHLPMTIESATATIGAQSFPVTGYTSPVADNDTTYATTTVPAGTTGTITLRVYGTWPDGVRDTEYTSVDIQSNCSTTTTCKPSTTTTTTTTTLPPTTTTTETTTSTTSPPTTSTEETTTSLAAQGSTTTSAPATTTTTETTTSTTSPPTTSTEETTTSLAAQGSTTTSAPPTTLPPPTSTEETTTTIFSQGSTTLFVPTTSTTTPAQAATTVGPQGGPVTTVAPLGGSLPRTGRDTGLPVAFGLSCVVAGALLAVRRRRAWSRP